MIGKKKEKKEKEPLECTISFSPIYVRICSTPQVDKAQTQPISYESLDSALALAFALTLAFAFAFAWMSFDAKIDLKQVFHGGGGSGGQVDPCHIIKHTILLVLDLFSPHRPLWHAQKPIHQLNLNS